MTIDNEYTILTDFVDCIIRGRLEKDGPVEPIFYEELPSLPNDVLEDIKKVEDIYYNRHEIEVGWKDDKLRELYNSLMMDIGTH